MHGLLVMVELFNGWIYGAAISASIGGFGGRFFYYFSYFLFLLFLFLNIFWFF